MRIERGVGEGETNLRQDVTTVQKLLNKHLQAGMVKLRENGLCGPETVAAIRKYQQLVVRLPRPDGRITPNGPTFQFLSGRMAGNVSSSTLSARAGTYISPILIAAAQESQRIWGVPAAVTLAQWALESHWGHDMPVGSNNPFGIKAVGEEAAVISPTWEDVGKKRIRVEAKFRKFSSLGEAFSEHAKLLATNPVYRAAMANAKNPDAFAHALTGVYATDGIYGDRLIEIMKEHDLYVYDHITGRRP